MRPSPCEYAATKLVLLSVFTLVDTVCPACSQTLYFLFKVRRVRVIKNENRGGFIDRQRKGVGVGEEENYLLFLLELCAGYCALADVFKKNKKKNKTTSVYRLCFARKFEQNHCPRMQQFHFRFMCIAQKGLLLSSLM